MQLVLEVSHVDAAALASIEVAERLKDMPLGCCGQTPRAIEWSLNQAGEVTMVAPRIEKPVAAPKAS